MKKGSLFEQSLSYGIYSVKYSSFGNIKSYKNTFDQI